MSFTLEPSLHDKTVEALQEVIDPELGVNIWDLGLVYGLASETNETGNQKLTLTMTLTTPACPLSDVIEEQLAEKLDGLYDSFKVDWVWLPSWHAGLISADGKEMLRAVGFSL